MLHKGTIFLYTISRHLLPVFFLLFTGLGLAKASGTEPYQNELRGRLKKGDTLIVKDEKFRNPAYDWSKIKHHSVQDYIKLELLRDSMKLVKKAFTCELDLKVEYWSQPDQEDPVEIKSVPLKINYDTAIGATYQIQDIYEFANAHRVKITINEITVRGLEEAPGCFILTGQIFIERQYTLEPDVAIKPFVNLEEGANMQQKSGMSTMALTSPVPDATANKLKLSWTHTVGAEEVDLEWTTISSSTYWGNIVAQWEAGAVVNQPALEALFRNNATRITTEEQEYTISLVYSDDYLLFRMRTVTYVSGIRSEGAWSYAYRPVGSSEDRTAIIKLPAAWHEQGLNWQYSGTFAEGGKKKEVVSYMDGTLRSRQTVTVSNNNISSVAGTEEVAIVQQNVFDEFGRPVASLLPSPLKNESVLKYYPGAYLNSTGRAYDFRNVYGVIAGSVAGCINKPLPVSSQSGAGMYYSTNNNFKGNPTQLYHDYIPDAEGFPLAVTRYTADKTGRVSVQGGVGAAFQPDPAAPEQHTTRNFYSKPGQWELDRVFGSDAGPASHYMKHTVVDPNGQASVSYVNLSGKTVATALAGPAPAATEALSSLPAKTRITQPLLQPEDFVFDPVQLKMKGTTTYVTPIQDDVELDYDIEQLVHKYTQGLTICSNCFYELTITVTDNCGVVKYNTSTPVDIGSRTADCGLTANKQDSDTVSLAPGEYFITYELALSENVIADYAETYVQQNTNLRKQFDFIQDQLERVDLKGCYSECTTCLTSLRSENDFIARVLAKLTTMGVDVASNQLELSIWAKTRYIELLTACNAMQAGCAVSPCEDARKSMLTDVAPGGQYALFDVSNNALEQNINVLFKHFREVFPVLDTSSSVYKQNSFTDLAGRAMSPNDNNFTVSDLVVNWRSSWAELFLPYHPEKCKLDFCEQNASYLAWDEKVKTRTNAVADIPVILPGQQYQQTVPLWLLQADPFFTNAGSPGAAYYSEMSADILNYSTRILDMGQFPISGGNKSISGYVDYLLYCQDAGGSTNTSSLDPWDDCAPDANCRVPDREWQLYKKVYFELKEGYYRKIRNESNCATACPVGRPVEATPPGCPTTASFSITRMGTDSVAVTYEGTALDRQVSVIVRYPWGNTGSVNQTTVVFNPGVTSHTIFVGTGVLPQQVAVQTVTCSPVSNELRPCPTGAVSPVVLPAGTEQTGPNTFEHYSGGVRTRFTIKKGTSDVPDSSACSGSIVSNTFYSCLYLNIPDHSYDFQFSNVWLTECVVAAARMAGDTSIGTESHTSLLKNDVVTPMHSGTTCGDIMESHFNIQFNGEVHFTYYEYLVTYSGPPIPPGMTVNYRVEYQGEYLIDLTFSSSSGNPLSDLVPIDKTGPHGSEFYTAGDISISCDPGIPPCEEAYLYKTSRFPDYMSPLVSTETLISESHKKIISQITSACEAQADTWMEQLRPCLDGNSIDASTRNLLRAKLIEVCQLGGDIDHPFGASTTTPGRATAESYTSFKQVIISVLGANNFSMDCNPWLFDGPYPYKTKPQAAEKELVNTDADICNMLASEETQYTIQNPGTSFYQFLVTKYGTGMNISEAELISLQKGCNNCRYILDRTITQPVFLDPGAKGCVSASEFTAAVNALAAEAMAGFSASHVNYETVYTNYLNHYWGFTLSYNDYKAYEAKVAGNPNTSEKLCNSPVYSKVPVDPDACLAEVLRLAVNNGKRDYERYIEDEKQAFRRNYINICAATRASVKLKANQQYYHYTLYYYDLAGNLIRTVPPEGVHVLTEDWEFEAIRASRAVTQGACNYSGPAGNTGMVFARQQLASTLNHQGKSLEMWTYNPSGGSTQMLVTSVSHLLNVCINGRYLHVEIQRLLPNIPIGVSLTGSNHQTVDLQPLLPLKPWTHIVLQSNGAMDSGTLEVYVNGVLCASVPSTFGGGCGWAISTGGPSGIIYPENITALKHLRQYDRLLPAAEIAANAKESCLDITGAYPADWARLNVPSAGSETVALPGSTVETQHSGYYPSHTIPTSYAFNSLNKVVQQKSPDGGLSKFWYDEVGRLVVSQNEEQRTPVNLGFANRFSYTRYDALGRIVEVGEKSGGNDFSTVPHMTLPFAVYNAYLQSGTNADVVKTFYDAIPSGVSGINSSLGQGNLRKRVAVSAQFPDGITADQANYYNYDISGNVKTLWQQIKNLSLKRIDYEYDLVSGKVNFVAYQRGESDQFFYQYKYDAENRLVEAKSGITASIDWRGSGTIVNGRTDATYRYYLHGPLARTELGQVKLQGLDYAYTLQGWLKGMNGNGNVVDMDKEMGRDGVSNGVFADVMSYSLGYYPGDYKPVNTSALAFPLQHTPQVSDETGHALYNGNISLSTMGVNLPFGPTPVAYTYRYDQLNRLVKQRQHAQPDGTSGWSLAAPGQSYMENVSYDGNGNILNYLRKAGAGANMDQLSYFYPRDGQNRLTSNRLRHITDAVSASPIPEDLESQGENNYLYDNIGNLIGDAQAGIDRIEWTVYGKIKRITKAGSSLEYGYDAAGNRVYKEYTDGATIHRTWYVRDAQGNVLGLYGNKDGDGNTYWKEQHLYGSSRLGIWLPDMNMAGGTSDGAWSSLTSHRYELTNHLGNVLATIDYAGSMANFANVRQAQDYYPFGMLQPDRVYEFGGGGYRYGFNGKENDNEIKGEGNQQDYGMRVYDPRIGKFLSVDPLAKKFAFYTPYQFAGNTPIQAIDLDGAEPGLVWALETYMKWKFGDPTGIKTLKSGVETNIAIESRAASYHNNTVSEKDQQKLDATFGRQADQQVLAGSVQLMKFNIETSFEVTSTFVPIEKAAAIAVRSVAKLAGNAALERMLIGGAKSAGEGALTKSAGNIASHGMEFLDDGIRMVDQPLDVPIIDLVGFRKDHILNRHKAGAGISGKTEFPASWSNQRIVDEVNTIANNPNAPGGMGKYNSPYKTGVVDGIEIRVDFYPVNHPHHAGKVSTAYPTNVRPNP